MDAFRLLTRSTKLKLHARDEKSAHHLPSEGPSERSEVKPLNGKKRKRSREEAENGIDDVPDLFSLSRTSARNGGKNGRPEASSPALTRRLGSEIDGALPAVSEDERRRILTSHKIKIVNLTEYHKSTAETRISASKLKSKDVQGNRKALKGACRVLPQPLASFALLRTDYGVGRPLADNIAEQGYTMPTEVQLASIPLLLRPRTKLNESRTDQEVVPNLLTVAPTGSGKTLAFLVPLIEKLSREHHGSDSVADQRRVSALIVAPTKELVSQIVNEGRKLTQRTGVRITAMRKGMILHHKSTSAPPEEEEGSSDSEGSPGGRDRGLHTVVNSDILVTTPLLLVKAIASTQPFQGTPLSTITSLILDEADVLLDPLFRDQTLALWNACTNSLLHVSFWSATIGSNIEELVLSILQKRESGLNLPSNIPLLRCVVGLKDSAVSTISHKLIYAATEPGKLLGLRQLLHPPPAVDGRRTTPPLRPPFLVFTQTIERAIALHSELLYDIPSEAGGSSRIAVLHSDLSDSKRADVMTRFRKGQIWVLVTTDLLSRGVDFRGINGVVNYDIPTTSAAYVHRVGRTGRAGREGGVAVTFYTMEDVKYVKGIANVIAASEKGGEKVGDGGSGIQPWLLRALPDISKKDKQKLKARGVEVRRSIKGDEDEKRVKAKRKAKISTKSGYERRLENNRKGAVQGSQRRQQDSDMEDDEWGGIRD
jgi:ATP-dependent RNA helicase DDX52/ROK1